MPLSPPTDDEFHQWGWEMGSEAGRQLAEESDAFVGITLHPANAPAGLRSYGRAFLHAFVRAYRQTLTRSLRDREDVAADLLRHSAPAEPEERTDS
jgi:hypothetical protein